MKLSDQSIITGLTDTFSGKFYIMMDISVQNIMTGGYYHFYGAEIGEFLELPLAESVVITDQWCVSERE